jgi:hypothetical protein
VNHWARKRAVFRSCAQLVMLVCVALVSFGSDGVVQGKGGTVPCRYEHLTTRSHPSSAGNVELALGALGSQATGPERGLGGRQRMAWAAAGDWALTTVAGGG